MMTPVEFRRRLHRRPELSFREERTARFIAEQLGRAGIAHRPVAGTGILACIEGSGDRTQAVVLRADIDALPIEEQAAVAWRSEHPGAMHACGHDLHAAVLYGALLRLAARPDFEGTLFGLFQPGEELNPGGASRVLAEDPFAGYRIRAVIGEHVEPELPTGTLGFRPGKYMASNDEIRIRLEGPGGHAAKRAEHADTVSAAARLILDLTALNTPERIVSIGRIEAPGATNVIPDRIYMEGTMRTFDRAERASVQQTIEALARRNDAGFGVRTRVEFTPGYPCVVNDPALTRLAVALAEREGIPCRMLPLRTTSEDFGFYSERYPSLFYRLGVGPDSGRLHTAMFNPDEAAIPAGIRFMERLARKCFES